MRTRDSRSPLQNSRKLSGFLQMASRQDIMSPGIIASVSLPMSTTTCTRRCFAVQKNFGKPVEWGMVKDYAWSTPQLRKLDAPVRQLCPLETAFL